MLDAAFVLDMIDAAKESKRDDILIKRWIINYEKTGMPYEKFTESLKKTVRKTVDRRTAAEVDADLEKMMNGIYFK